MATYRSGPVIEIDRLEPRQLFAATAATPILNTSVDAGVTSSNVSLLGAFEDPASTVVRLSTDLGNVDVGLFDQATPATVANFLKYVTKRRFNNTIVHRSEPGFVVQLGGYDPTGRHIKTFPPVVNEFDPARSNLRGTLAMAKVGGDPNSATSEFFFNLADNSDNLDNQNGGFTTFARVLGAASQGVVDAIAALPRVNAGGAFDTLPVEQPIPQGGSITDELLVKLNTAAVTDDDALFTFNVSSDNPTLVNPSISGTNVVLTYGAGTGSARITVTATDQNGGTATQTFTAGVGQLDVEIGDGEAKSASFTDADGTRSTATLARGGTAVMRLEGAGLTQVINRGKITVGGAATRILSLAAVDTTLGSTLSIKSAGGADGLVELAALTTDASLNTFAGKGAKLEGNATFGGTINRLQLGQANNGIVTIGGTIADAAAILDITSATGATIAIGQPVRQLKAGTLNTSNLLVGVNGNTIPDDTLDFVGNIALSSAKIGTFINSNVSAFTLGKINLGRVTTTNSGVPFVAAAADSIATLSGQTDAGARFNFRNLIDQAAYDAAAAGIALGDMEVRVF